MSTEDAVLQIAMDHVKKVRDFDPYKKFAGIENADQFRKLIANDPAFKFFGLNDSR